MKVRIIKETHLTNRKLGEVYEVSQTEGEALVRWGQAVWVADPELPEIPPQGKQEESK